MRAHTQPRSHEHMGDHGMHTHTHRHTQGEGKHVHTHTCADVWPERAQAPACPRAHKRELNCLAHLEAQALATHGAPGYAWV
jgi:hypothetical protein